MSNNINNLILLIIRVLIGGIIVYTGYEKILNIDWGTISISTLNILSVKSLWIVTIIQFLLGLGIIFGIWTRLMSLSITTIIITTVYLTKEEAVNTSILLIGSLILMTLGGGKWTILACKKKHPMPNLPVATKF